MGLSQIGNLTLSDLRVDFFGQRVALQLKGLSGANGSARFQMAKDIL